MCITKEDIARVCHEVNRAYCQAIGDNSQQVWDDAPQWQKESAIDGVEKLTANPNLGPEFSHESWMAEKVAKGWKWGPEKNGNEKEHPCIVPFDELPIEQKAKDYIFRAIVLAMRGIPSDTE